MKNQNAQLEHLYEDPAVNRFYKLVYKKKLQ